MPLGARGLCAGSGPFTSLKVLSVGLCLASCGPDAVVCSWYLESVDLGEMSCFLTCW